jgi:hypothetical protein
VLSGAALAGRRLAEPPGRARGNTPILLPIFTVDRLLLVGALLAILITPAG